MELCRCCRKVHKKIPLLFPWNATEELQVPDDFAQEIGDGSLTWFNDMTQTAMQDRTRKSNDNNACLSPDASDVFWSPCPKGGTVLLTGLDSSDLGQSSNDNNMLLSSLGSSKLLHHSSLESGFLVENLSVNKTDIAWTSAMATPHDVNKASLDESDWREKPDPLDDTPQAQDVAVNESSKRKVFHRKLFSPGQSLSRDDSLFKALEVEDSVEGDVTIRDEEEDDLSCIVAEGGLDFFQENSMANSDRFSPRHSEFKSKCRSPSKKTNSETKTGSEIRLQDNGDNCMRQGKLSNEQHESENENGSDGFGNSSRKDHIVNVLSALFGSSQSSQEEDLNQEQALDCDITVSHISENKLTCNTEVIGCKEDLTKYAIKDIQWITEKNVKDVFEASGKQMSQESLQDSQGDAECLAAVMTVVESENRDCLHHALIELEPKGYNEMEKKEKVLNEREKNCSVVDSSLGKTKERDIFSQTVHGSDFSTITNDSFSNLNKGLRLNYEMNIRFPSSPSSVFPYISSTVLPATDKFLSILKTPNTPKSFNKKSVRFSLAVSDPEEDIHKPAKYWTAEEELRERGRVKRVEEKSALVKDISECDDLSIPKISLEKSKPENTATNVSSSQCGAIFSESGSLLNAKENGFPDTFSVASSSQSDSDKYFQNGECPEREQLDELYSSQVEDFSYSAKDFENISKNVKLPPHSYEIETAALEDSERSIYSSEYDKFTFKSSPVFSSQAFVSSEALKAEQSFQNKLCNLPNDGHDNNIDDEEDENIYLAAMIAETSDSCNNVVSGKFDRLGTDALEERDSDSDIQMMEVVPEETVNVCQKLDDEHGNQPVSTVLSSSSSSILMSSAHFNTDSSEKFGKIETTGSVKSSGVKSNTASLMFSRPRKFLYPTKAQITSITTLVHDCKALSMCVKDEKDHGEMTLTHVLKNKASSTVSEQNHVSCLESLDLSEARVSVSCLDTVAGESSKDNVVTSNSMCGSSEKGGHNKKPGYKEVLTFHSHDESCLAADVVGDERLKESLKGPIDEEMPPSMNQETLGPGQKLLGFAKFSDLFPEAEDGDESNTVTDDKENISGDFLVVVDKLEELSAATNVAECHSEQENQSCAGAETKNEFGRETTAFGNEPDMNASNPSEETVDKDLDHLSSQIWELTEFSQMMPFITFNAVDKVGVFNKNVYETSEADSNLKDCVDEAHKNKSVVMKSFEPINSSNFDKFKYQSTSSPSGLESKLDNDKFKENDQEKDFEKELETLISKRKSDLFKGTLSSFSVPLRGDKTHTSTSLKSISGVGTKLPVKRTVPILHSSRSATKLEDFCQLFFEGEKNESISHLENQKHSNIESRIESSTFYAHENIDLNKRTHNNGSSFESIENSVKRPKDYTLCNVSKSSNSDLSPFQGFSTAGGKNIHISETAKEKADKIWANIDESYTHADPPSKSSLTCEKLSVDPNKKIDKEENQGDVRCDIREPQSNIKGDVRCAIREPQSNIKGDVRCDIREPQSNIKGDVRCAIREPQSNIKATTKVDDIVCGFSFAGGNTISLSHSSKAKATQMWESVSDQSEQLMDFRDKETTTFEHEETDQGTCRQGFTMTTNKNIAINAKLGGDNKKILLKSDKRHPGFRPFKPPKLLPKRIVSSASGKLGEEKTLECSKVDGEVGDAAESIKDGKIDNSKLSFKTDRQIISESDLCSKTEGIETKFVETHENIRNDDVGINPEISSNNENGQIRANNFTTDTDTGILPKFTRFSTLSGYDKDISTSALERDKTFFQEENFDKKGAVSGQLNSKHPCEMKVANTKGCSLTGNISNNVDNPQGFPGFSTALGNCVKVTQRALILAKSFFDEDNSDNDSTLAAEKNADFLGVSTASTSNVMGVGKSMKQTEIFGDKECKQKNGNTAQMSANFHGFSTATGSKVIASVDALYHAKKLFDEDALTNKTKIVTQNSVSVPGFSSALGSIVTISDNAVNQAEPVFGDDCSENSSRSNTKEKNEKFPGFSTASGSTVEVSKNALNHAKTFFDGDSWRDDDKNIQNNLLPKFSTTSVSEVGISENFVEHARTIFDKEDHGKSIAENENFSDFCSMSNLKGNDQKLRTAMADEDCDKNNTMDLAQNISKFPGFSTASGSNVNVSKNSMKHARTFFDDGNCGTMHAAQDTSKFPALSSTSKVTVSENSLRRAKAFSNVDRCDDLLDLQTVSKFPGFSSASGSNVNISEQSLKHAKTFFNDDRFDHEPQTFQKFPEFSFVSGSKGNISDSENSLKYAKTKTYVNSGSSGTLPVPQITSNGSGFSTASGCKVNVSEKSLKHATAFFYDEGCDGSKSSSIDKAIKDISESSYLGNHTLVDSDTRRKNSVKSTKFEESTSSPPLKRTCSQTVKLPLRSSCEEYLNDRQWQGTTGYGRRLNAVQSTTLSANTCWGTMWTQDQMNQALSSKENGIDLESTTDLSNMTHHKFGKAGPSFIPPPSTLNQVKACVKEQKKVSVFEAESKFPLFLPKGGNPKRLTRSSLKCLKRKPEGVDKVSLSHLMDQDHSQAASDIEKVSDPSVKEKTVPLIPTANLSSKGGIDTKRAGVYNDLAQNSLSCETSKIMPNTASGTNDRNNSEIDPISIGSFTRNKTTNGFNSPCSEMELSNEEENRFLCESLMDQGNNVIPLTEVQPRASNGNAAALEADLTSSDMLMDLKEAKLKQEKIIADKKKRKVVPLSGRWWNNRAVSGKTSQLHNVVGDCQSHSRSELLSHGVSESTLNVSSQSASEYRFNLRRFHPSLKASLLIGDGAFLVPDKHGFAGVSEFYSAFLTLGGVDPTLVNEAWLRNHYRWIIWKLACYEVCYPSIFAKRCLTPDVAMLQLKYRYDREVDKCHRSAIRKIVERDDTPFKRMVLCVADIVRNFGNQQMSDRVLKRQKLVVSGVELNGIQDGCAPLEIPDSAHLKLNFNATRPAKLHSRLGFCQVPLALCVPLASVHPDGGTVGCVDVVVTRKYHLMYMEKSSDKGCIFRTSEEEDAARRKEDECRHIRLEKMSASIQEQMESKQASRKKSGQRNLRRKEIENLSTGPELVEALDNAMNPEEFQQFLNENQMNKLMNQKRIQMEHHQDEMNRRLKEAMSEERLTSRNVAAVQKFRVMGCCPCDIDSTCGCLLTVWRPGEEWQDIQEGKRYKIFNLSASACRQYSQVKCKVSLMANRQTRLQARNIRESVLDLVYEPRQIHHVSELREKCKIRQTVEFDFVGVALAVYPSKQHGHPHIIYAADPAGEILSIKLWSNLQHSLPPVKELDCFVATGLNIRSFYGSGNPSLLLTADGRPEFSTLSSSGHSSTYANIFIELQQRCKDSTFVSTAKSRLESCRQNFSKNLVPIQKTLSTTYEEDFPPEIVEKIFCPMGSQDVNDFDPTSTIQSQQRPAEDQPISQGTPHSKPNASSTDLMLNRQLQSKPNHANNTTDQSESTLKRISLSLVEESVLQKKKKDLHDRMGHLLAYGRPSPLLQLRQNAASPACKRRFKSPKPGCS